MNLKTLDEIEVNGKKVLVRVDFNVPLDENFKITDDTRIRAVLPTINHILDNGGKVIIISHLGRPGGQIVPGMSLRPVVKRLSRLVSQDVIFGDDCVGDKAKEAISKLDKDHSVVLLENLRFHRGEGNNDDNFARQLAELANVYVNDAFATAHRTHASNNGITKFLQPAVAGFLMNQEVSYFNRAMENPVRPLVAVLGGAKVSSKIGVIENLLKKVDKVIIGGGMMFTFLKVMGYETGKSLVENDMLETAEKILKSAMEHKVKFYLPVDCVIAERFDARAESKIVPVQEIPKNWIGLDIGPASCVLFGQVVSNAKTIVWNGPMGVFEMDAFSRGTFSMVEQISNSFALTIVGGGDTDVAIHRAGATHMVSYISTAGGAFLELLEGKTLPAFTRLNP